MKRLLVWISCAALVAGAEGQTLWRDTVAGMSIEQVRKLIPEAASVVATPSAGPGTSDAHLVLKLPPLELGGLLFDPTLDFSNNRLERVRLYAEGRPLREVQAAFEAVRDALRAKYGNEVANDVRNQRTEPFGTMKWINGRTTIQLTIFSFGALGTGTVFVNYNSSLAALGDKL